MGSSTLGIESFMSSHMRRGQSGTSKQTTTSPISPSSALVREAWHRAGHWAKAPKNVQKLQFFFYCEKKPYIMVPKVKKKLKIMEKKFEFLNIFSTFGPVCTVTPRRTRRAWPASWLQDQKSKRLAQSTNATTA